MADEESKKTIRKNAKEEGEEENKRASKDAETASEQANDSQDDEATKHKTGGKLKDDKKEEEESSDEELLGSLDAPLVVEGKRARKTTEFLSHNIATSPITHERKKIVVPEGKGEPLGSMPRVQFQLNQIVGDELKPLHKLLYGRPGTAMEVKRNIRLFKGFDMEKGSKEYKKKEEQVDRFTQTSIKRLCDILDVDKRGTQDLPEPTKKGQAKKKKSSKKKESSSSSKGKSTNAKSKKVKSNKNVESEEESEKDENMESEENDTKSPTKKKKKAPSKKSEAKKPSKKDKKVVSIKISPGSKAKNSKAKRKKEDDDSEDEPLSKKKKKTPPTDEEIVELVKEILEDADLEKVTMKSVCKQVYDRFPDFDLTDRKEFIKDSVKEIIT